MNNDNPFMGLGVALVTPFSLDGKIDYTALCKLVEFQIANGTDYLCVLGTTAETPTLTSSEQLSVVQAVIKQNRGRIPLLVGCSANCTATLLERLDMFNIEGIDGILSAVPYYNKPNQEGIYQHFKALAESCKKPIVLYNIPGRTGVNMLADTTLRLALEFTNIIGIKEASGNMEQIEEIINRAPLHFKVISGDDSLAYDAMIAGAVGVISVIGNLLPKSFGELIHHIQCGNIEKATEIHNRLLPLYPLLFKEGNPAGVKALMSERGYLNNILRLPLTTVSSETYHTTVETFSTFKL